MTNHPNRKLAALRRNMIANAVNYVVVDDGAYRWAGEREEIYAWLRAHEKYRSLNTSTNQSNSVELSSDEYDQMCRETMCKSDVIGPSGTGQCIDLCSDLMDAGASMLHID